jgi:glycerophosphoryl diester phosphodiesterase
VISFDERAIDRVHELDDELRTGYLLVPGQSVEGAIAWAADRGHASVFPWEGDLGHDPGPLVARAAAYGRQIGCYVVNDPERMLVLALAGVWAFATDEPELARATLPRASG